MKVESRYKTFHSCKCFCKCRLWNGGHFLQGEISWFGPGEAYLCLGLSQHLFWQCTNLTDPAMHLPRIPQYEAGALWDLWDRTFLFWFAYCEIWGRLTVGFVRLVYWALKNKLHKECNFIEKMHLKISAKLYPFMINIWVVIFNGLLYASGIGGHSVWRFQLIDFHLLFMRVSLSLQLINSLLYCT